MTSAINATSITFKPLNVGRNTLSNRLVLAPLTRMRNPSNVPTDLAVEYYRKRATAVPGSLLITEATFISPQAGGYALAPGIWSEEQIQAWKKVTDAVHEEGSFIYVQLWNLGRQADPETLKKEGHDYVSSSSVAMKGHPVPRALTIEEIKQHIQWYIQAAKNALAAGFDGVEIHNANGYLLDQFLHDCVNQRADAYGGSIENRARFTLEVVDAVCETIGADRVGIRFGPWGEFGDVNPGITPIPQWSYVVAELERRGQQGKRLSYIHAIEPRMDGWASEGQVPRHLNNFFRDIWQGVLIRAGGFGRNAKEIQDLQARDENLLVALGRLYISNPDVARKIRDNVPLDLYDRDTFYWDGKGDPALGYTKEFKRK